MARERHPQPTTIVYSTDPRAKGAPPLGARAADRRPASLPAVSDGIVRIWLEKKGRNGKPVSIVRGLGLEPAALAELATRLKRACSSGGSAKNGEIIIQGDHRSRIAAELTTQGLRVKLAGG